VHAQKGLRFRVDEGSVVAPPLFSSAPSHSWACSTGWEMILWKRYKQIAVPIGAAVWQGDLGPQLPG
jgi:hypothetical protein